jgi:hypothetical protein
MVPISSRRQAAQSPFSTDTGTRRLARHAGHGRQDRHAQEREPEGDEHRRVGRLEASSRISPTEGAKDATLHGAGNLARNPEPRPGGRSGR